MKTIDRIFEIKKELGEDLLILAHHYQNDDIISTADFVGDSLKLAQYAQKNKRAKYIVFCGVYFMSETADILTEDYQRVLQPAITAGCPMADMADMKQAERAWEIITEELGCDIVPITYVNSKAEVKAFCGNRGGTTVTSGNAARVVDWGLKQNKVILFLPDRNLGRNTAYDLGIPLECMAEYDPRLEKLEYSCKKEDVRIVLWKGHCHVHHNITVKQIEDVRRIHPDAEIIVHPECRFEITRAADGKGSTEYLIDRVKNGKAGSKWVVGTEHNLVKRLKDTYTDKEVYILDTSSVCTNMNKTDAENLLETLEDILKGNFEKQVVVDKTIAQGALRSLETMLSLV